MAANPSLRCVLDLARPSTRRALRQTRRSIQTSSDRLSFSTSIRARQDASTDPAGRPRWQTTPKAMIAPVRSRPRPLNNDYRVNDDPRRLNDAYVRMLGNGGDRLLSEEVKWLAVTHKSFDHGRRGFNDRLAYLGKRIVDLQTSLALLNAPKPAPHTQSPSPEDEYGRRPFQHPALDGLENLTESTKADVVDKRRLARLAEQYGLGGVVRWKPRKADNLQGSGVEVVLAQTLYAIVGAIALEKGGDVANKTVREKILNPLGVSY